MHTGNVIKVCIFFNDLFVSGAISMIVALPAEMDKTLISTYSCERTKTVELFPRTEITHKNHARPIPANGQIKNYIPDIYLMLSFHVETVCLLSITDFSISCKNQR